MSLDNAPRLFRRLPVRRGALPRRGRARRRVDLPLPHVPEGQRQFLSAAGFGARRQARLDARRAETASSRRTSCRRGFCGDCGTPLSYEAPDGVALAIGAFDDPAVVAPTIQWGIEAKLPYVDSIPALPGETTLEDVRAASFLHDLVSYQHPDHDTDQWPPDRRQANE